MTILHPYQFVPLGAAPARKALAETANHERFAAGLHSGRLRCRLETLTMLCIKPHFAALRKEGAAPYLPGSSLKGMVRSMGQVLGAGCGLLFEDTTKDPKHKGRERRRPDLTGFDACKEGSACLACRVFGYAPGQTGWAGKVRFPDSGAAAGWRGEWAAPPELRGGGAGARWQSQGTYHTAFYYPDAANPQTPAGWKVYRHADRVTAPAEDFRPAACVAAGTQFEFDVDYESLDDEEYAVLRFALSLTHRCKEWDVSLAHKLGYGKGIGMGSCRVTIEETRPYRVFWEKAGEDRPEADCAIHEYLKRPGFGKLREFLDWEKRTDRLEYPDYGWFARSGGASIEDFEKSKNAGAGGSGAKVRMVKAPPAEARRPNKVDVEVTRVNGRGEIFYQTVEEFDGTRYEGKAAPLNGARVGAVMELKVGQWDAEKRMVTGRLAWKL